MASFKWTPPEGGSAITFTLPHKLLFRDGSLGRARSRFRSVALDQRTTVTELLTSSAADVVGCLVRFVKEPALLSKMLADGADGALLTYTDDAGNVFPSLLLEGAGPITEATLDSDRFGFGEWERTLRLRQVTGETLARLFPNFVPTALVLPGDSGDYAEVASDPLLHTVGNHDIRVAVALDDWSVDEALADNWVTPFTWLFSYDTSGGGVKFFFRDDANTQFLTTRDFAGGLPGNGELVLIRVELLPQGGGATTSHVKIYSKEGLTTTQAWTALLDDSGWTQLGTTASHTTSGVVQTNTEPIRFGRDVGGQGAMSGKYYGGLLKLAGNNRLEIPFSDVIPGLTEFEERANGFTVQVIQSVGARLELDV